MQGSCVSRTKIFLLALTVNRDRNNHLPPSTPTVRWHGPHWQRFQRTAFPFCNIRDSIPTEAVGVSPLHHPTRGTLQPDALMLTVSYSCKLLHKTEPIITYLCPLWLSPLNICSSRRDCATRVSAHQITYRRVPTPKTRYFIACPMIMQSRYCILSPRATAFPFSVVCQA